jgi:hypothetical protein
VALLPGPPAASYQTKEQGRRRGQLQSHEARPAAGAGSGQRGRRWLHAAAQALLQLGQGLVGGGGRGLQQAF